MSVASVCLAGCMCVCQVFGDQTPTVFFVLLGEDGCATQAAGLAIACLDACTEGGWNGGCTLCVTPLVGQALRGMRHAGGRVLSALRSKLGCGTAQTTAAALWPFGNPVLPDASTKAVCGV